MPEATVTPDFFRPRLAEMIDLRHPLAMLASRRPGHRSRWRWRRVFPARFVRAALWRKTICSAHPCKSQAPVSPQQAARAFPFA